MATRLNDTQVNQEMQKMVAFIKQEALEKARETKIKVIFLDKADEEFNIEKGKLVRQETLAIEAFFEKKIKVSDVNRKIQKSHVINKNRLSILQKRQEATVLVFEEAREGLKNVAASPTYSDLVFKLVIQGYLKLMRLYTLMEPNVVLQAREADYGLIEGFLAKAQDLFKSSTKKTTTIKIDKSNPLPAKSAGGVVLGSPDFQIKCDNTLEARLVLLQDMMLPEIREELFGVSPNRKFFT